MKLLNYSFTLAVIAGCAGGEFAGTNDVGNNSEPLAEALKEPTKTGDLTSKQCIAELKYDPESVQCNISINRTDTVWWDTRSGFRTAQIDFADQSANWIAPEAEVKTADGTYGCPELKDVYKNIFVAHFKLEASTPVDVSAIMDNSGIVRIWKDADPTKEVFFSSDANPVKKLNLPLDAGNYTVVSELKDDGLYSGFVFSIQHSDSKAVIKNTSKDKDWCIFQVASDTVVSDFLPKTASCLKCYKGE